MSPANHRISGPPRRRARSLSTLRGSIRRLRRLLKCLSADGQATGSQTVRYEARSRYRAGRVQRKRTRAASPSGATRVLRTVTKPTARDGPWRRRSSGDGASKIHGPRRHARSRRSSRCQRQRFGASWQLALRSRLTRRRARVRHALFGPRPWREWPGLAGSNSKRRPPPMHAACQSPSRRRQRRAKPLRITRLVTA